MTQTVQHTPGPWEIWPDFDEEGENGSSIIGTNGDPLAVTISDRYSEDANAHLIAAAPELLEALEMIANDYAYLLETKLSSPDADMIHELIAKAKGGAS